MTLKGTENPLQNHDKPTSKVDYVSSSLVVRKNKRKIHYFASKLTVTFI
jgi:hypothetical protein